jgi:aspartyl/glutamyl-tRNA(Asn/Gln) amidotransferase C subunit
MSDEITPELFEHLVELAALELDADESEYLRRELNNQLISIKIMNAIPLDDSVEAASHGVPFTPEISQPAREDEIISSGKADAILAQSPETEDRYIVVPETKHEKLD